MCEMKGAIESQLGFKNRGQRGMEVVDRVIAAHKDTQVHKHGGH